MRQKKFFNVEHAQRYLPNSIIRLKGIPIYVGHVEGGGKRGSLRLTYNYLGDPDSSFIYLPNKDVNMNPVPLGFINLKSGTFYICRCPIRAWKIGLSANNIRIFRAVGSPNTIWNLGERQEVLMSKEMEDTILGRYPSYREAVDTSEKEGRLVAFSRSFGCLEGKTLVYKFLEDPVGTCNRLQPKLSEGYQFLDKVLEEATRK